MRVKYLRMSQSRLAFERLSNITTNKAAAAIFHLKFRVKRRQICANQFRMLLLASCFQCFRVLIALLG